MITSTRQCSIEGCGRPHQARGWCKKHYDRWKGSGDPMTPPRGAVHLIGDTPYERLMTIVERHPSGCLIATERLDNNGYPRISVTTNGKRRMVRGHRIVWEHLNGAIPPGKNVLHSCDNPSCVEITHLRLGSLADNSRDVAVRDRRLVLGHGKLSIADAQTIKDRVTAGESQSSIARDLGISQSHVSNIVNGKARKHMNTSHQVTVARTV